MPELSAQVDTPDQGGQGMSEVRSDEVGQTPSPQGRTLSLESLLARLQAGHKWLAKEHKALLAMSNIGLGSMRETKFLEGLDLWDHLDFTLRFAYPEYHQCVWSSGTCRGHPVLTCRACAERMP